MHKAYQPLKPATNKLLQKKWDQTCYEEHRKKNGKCSNLIAMCNQQKVILLFMLFCHHEVKEVKPVVDIKGIPTPTHVQLKLKKTQRLKKSVKFSGGAPGQRRTSSIRTDNSHVESTEEDTQHQ
ncbi:hypothetical protein P4O66_015623 [Electrophorus voltai]|uniref:Uncharacterized protein n=1 Tax=Electrophorus voltai TaxID=2609070 RepID=A0AAD8YZ84_9TELE|nr:hypothetical protein P4O66_015623 [Electrophorus voltai]